MYERIEEIEEKIDGYAKEEIEIYKKSTLSFWMMIFVGIVGCFIVIEGIKQMDVLIMILGVTISVVGFLQFAYKVNKDFKNVTFINKF